MKKGKIFKKLFLLPMFLITFMFFGTVNAEDAPSTVTIDGSKTSTSSKGYITVKSSSQPLLAPVQYVNVGGSSVAAYCLDMNKIDYQGRGGTALQKQGNAITEPGYVYLLKNGTSTALGLSYEQAAYVTQMALWWYQDAKHGTSNLDSAFKNTATAKSVYNDTYNLYDKIAQLATGAINATSSTSSSTGKLTITGDTSMKYNSNYTGFTAGMQVTGGTVAKAEVDGSHTTGISSSNVELEVHGNIIAIKAPINKISGLSGKITIKVTGTGSTSSQIVGYKYGTDSSYQQLLVPITTTSDAEATWEVSFARTQVTVKKVDESGNRLGQAQLQIKELSSGKVVHSWTSSAASDEIIYDLPAGVSYQVEEVSAPSGYVKAQTQLLVPVAGTNKVITVKNKKETTQKEPDEITIRIIKKDENGINLSGARMKLTCDGITIADFTTSSSYKIITNSSIKDGAECTLEEVSAPSGYILNTQKVTKKVYASTLNEFQMTNIREQIQLEPDKVNIRIVKKNENGSYLAGARMKFTCDGITIADFETNTSYKTITSSSIKDGAECTLEEVSAPGGYILNTQKVTKKVYTSTLNVFEMTNIPNEFPVSKQDATTGKELPGATLEIKNALGQTIDKWVSTSEPHIVKGLADGVYILRETIAPDGYVLASSITFTIKDGKVSEPIVMKNESTIVNFEKRAKETSKFLKGAELVVKDSNGREIYRWNSTDEAHTIRGLVVGKTYTLEEVTAPNGYNKANPVTFTVKDSNEIQVVVMYDDLTIVEVPDTASFTSMMIYGTGAFVLVTGVLGTILYMKRRKNEQF